MFNRIPLVNFLSGMLGVFVIFGYLGYFSKLINVPIQELPLAGPDLIFVTIPAALTTLPLPELWIVFFLIAMLMLGIDSQIALVECISYVITDYKPKLRGILLSEFVIRFIVCFFLFAFGIIYSTRMGYDILCFVNDYLSFLPFIIPALFQVYIFGDFISLFS